MHFCSNCGVQVQDNANFCANCGHKLVLQVNENIAKQQSQLQLKTANDWNLLQKGSIILALIFAEVVAAIGALPLYYYHKSFWWKHWPVTVVFGVVIIAVTLILTWKRPLLTKVTSILFVSGLLAFTILLIQSFI